MDIKVGINGFGRIGRVISRVCLQNSDLQLSAINDPAISTDYISYLIKFDSTHGKLNGKVSHTDDGEISINDNRIMVFHEKLPKSVPWHAAGVQYVVEASGMFTSIEKASGHLASDGVKRVIVTAPSADAPMIILGVNDNQLNVDQKVISCASSTLYCLAPIIKVLEDNFGIVDGFMTSIHAMTPSLRPLDGLCVKGKMFINLDDPLYLLTIIQHWRDHRSILQNIIPAATGACKALGKIIPQVKDKLSGLAFRVPIVNVSVLDLSIRLKSYTTLNEIIKCIETASNNGMQNVIKISNEETVSSDFIGETHSCIFDETSSIQLKPNFFKIICWYENEYSYACRIADCLILSEKQNSQITELLSKTTCVRTKCYKQDEMLQTECFMNEIAVSCSRSEISCQFTCSPSQEKIEKRQIFIKPLELSPQSTNNNNEMFKIWNDTNEKPKPTVTQNRNEFFQTCKSLPKPITEMVEAKTRLENVKSEFSKMVNIISEYLLKENSRSVTQSISKNDIGKSIGQCKAKDKHFVAETESLKKNCGDFRDFKRSFKNENNLSTTIEASTVSENNAEISKKDLHSPKFKEHLAKTINLLFDGMTRNIQAQRCLADETRENPKFADMNGIDTNEEPIKENTCSKAFLSISNQNKVCGKAALNLQRERFKIQKNKSNVKLIDEELRNRSLVLFDSTIVPDIGLNSGLGKGKGIENVGKSYKTQEDKNFDIQKSDELKIKPKLISEDSGYHIPTYQCERMNINRPTTGTSLGIGYEFKQDIYDKLDSASGTDSTHSFEINRKTSQIIQLSDLTNSLENLNRLDKICRIIEISDEMSDQLFSALDNKDFEELKKTRWSFRDLCEKIHLDEFCNKVFGKPTV